MPNVSLYDPLLDQGIRARFIQGLQAPSNDDLVNRAAMEQPSSAASETYAWIGEPPQVRNITDKPFEDTDLSTASYTINNLEWGSSVTVKKTDLDDDQVAGIMTRIDQMVAVARDHRNALLVTALINGTTDLGYDGSAFFADAHADRSPLSVAVGTQDNLLASGYTGQPTAAEYLTAVAAGIATMMGFLGENGEPLHSSANLRDFLAVVPVDMLEPVQQAMRGQLIGGGNSNATLDGFNVSTHFSPRLTDVNDFYLLHTGGSLKPLMFQNREGLTFTVSEDKRKRTKTWHTYARYNIGYGHWGHAVKQVSA